MLYIRAITNAAGTDADATPHQCDSLLPYVAHEPHELTVD
jgi:hypothetical protein